MANDPIEAAFEKLARGADLMELEAVEQRLGHMRVESARYGALDKRKRELLATLWPEAYPKITETQKGGS